MDSEEVQSGRAIDLKAKRAGHLGDLRKRLKFVQRLISEHAREEVIQGVDDYESALHRFVDAHETYLKFEDNEEMVNTANKSYEKEKENTFLLDVELNMWKLKMKHNTKGMLRSVHKSRRSRKTGRSSNSSRSSVRDKRRILEEAQLKVEVLERKQSLERRLEEEKVDFKRRELEIAEDRERSKAELARKIERMQAEMEFKKATVDLEIEQEELQNDHSDNETLASDIIPALPLELGSHASPTPVSLPSNVFLPVDPLFDAQNVMSEALKVDHGVSSASLITAVHATTHSCFSVERDFFKGRCK